jgi:hypothetical protein
MLFLLFQHFTLFNSTKSQIVLNLQSYLPLSSLKSSSTLNAWSCLLTPHFSTYFPSLFPRCNISTTLPLLHLTFFFFDTLPSPTNLQHRTNTNHTFHHHRTTISIIFDTMNTPDENVTTAAVQNSQIVLADSLGASTTADAQDVSLAPGVSEAQHITNANDLAEYGEESEEEESDEEDSDQYESNDVCNVLRCQMILSSHMILGSRHNCTL